MNRNEAREDAILGMKNSKAWDAWRTPANDNHAGRTLPKVVALTGLAGAGKSTLADHLIKTHGYTRVKFAGPLKSMLYAIGLSESQIEGDLKETPAALLQGKTPRYAMQTIGTEWGRAFMGPGFWTGLWHSIASDVLDNGGRVVTDDVRFDNEADMVRDMGGVVFEVKGRGGIPGGHVSEAGVDADVVISNVGTIAELLASVDREVWAA